MRNCPDTEAILDKSCLVCRKPNRFHKVFFSPYYDNYCKQWIDKDWNNNPLITGHYACLTNLELLEYESDKYNI